VWSDEDRLSMGDRRAGTPALRESGSEARRSASRPGLAGGPLRGPRVAPGTWNAGRVVDALRAWTARYGDPPRAFEWAPTMGRAVGLLAERPCRWERQYPRWPSYTTVCRYLGDWHAALAAAGLRAPRSPRMALEDRVDAARRLASDAQTPIATIAAILDVHPSTVRGYLSAGHCPACGRVKVRAEARTCLSCRPKHRSWPALTDEQLLDCVRAWTARFGAPPTKGQWRSGPLGGHPAWEREHPAWPSPAVLERRFGSWRAALTAAGVAAPAWTHAKMLCALRRFAAEHGRPPTAREWPRNCDQHPSASMVSDAFGGWHAALRRAGLTPTHHGPWTEHEIAAALRRLAAELGRPPSGRDLDRAAGRAPGRTTIRRRYGSLANALRAADLVAGHDPRRSRQRSSRAGEGGTMDRHREGPRAARASVSVCRPMTSRAT
jgi:hypothetical protein